MAVKKASKRKGLLPTMHAFIGIPPDAWKIIISFWECGQGIKYIKSNVFTGIFYMFSGPKETETKYTCNKDICAACGLSCIYWPYKDPYNIVHIHNPNSSLNFNEIEKKDKEKKIRIDTSNINISTNGIVISCGKKDTAYVNVCSQKCAQLFLYEYLIKEMEEIVKSFHRDYISDYSNFLGNPYEYAYRYQTKISMSNHIQFNEEYLCAKDNIVKLENSKMLSSNFYYGIREREYTVVYDLEFYKVYLHNMVCDIIKSDIQSQSTSFNDFEYYLYNYIKLVDDFTLF